MVQVEVMVLVVQAVQAQRQGLAVRQERVAAAGLASRLPVGLAAAAATAAPGALG